MSRTTNYLPDMTGNLKPTTALKGFAAKVAAEAARCWSTPLPLGTFTVPQLCPTSALPGQSYMAQQLSGHPEHEPTPAQPGPNSRGPEEILQQSSLYFQ